ncbi:MAG: AI-2E family transporter [Bacteroidales bacterium]|nr:AI-2E family transporter [Bacteroidales bacterium]
MRFKPSKELLISSLIIFLGLAFVYYFTSIVVYMIIAAVVALLVNPLKQLFQKISIRGKSIGNNLSSVMALLSFLVFTGGIISLLIPAIVSQTSELANLDYNAISQNINNSFIKTESTLRDYGIIDSNETLAAISQTYIQSFISGIQIDQITSGAISTLGSLFMGFFSIVFISFFFIRDENMFQNIILLFVPEIKKKNVQHILIKIKKMLSRYFIGLMTEMGAMMILESIGGFIIGLENAILLGFLGGLLNIIPYIGPLIGGFLAAVLVTISNISLGIDATIPLVIGIVTVFAIANLIDNFLLQPIIYSNSVLAHPLEIFIVIIVGGSLYGPLGMILAIPVYTILRVIAKEFFSELDIVKKVTKSI